MKYDFFLSLLICLHISIFVHIVYIAAYIEGKKYRELKGYRYTRYISIFFAVLIALVIYARPAMSSKVRSETIMLIESGFIFFFLLFVKISITVRIFKRSRNSDYYDISFFGKKVYKLEVVKKSELAVYLVSMPFTLMTGAYFIANIIAL